MHVMSMNIRVSWSTNFLNFLLEFCRLSQRWNTEVAKTHCRHVTTVKFGNVVKQNLSNSYLTYADCHETTRDWEAHFKHVISVNVECGEARDLPSVTLFLQIVTAMNDNGGDSLCKHVTSANIGGWKDVEWKTVVLLSMLSQACLEFLESISATAAKSNRSEEAVLLCLLLEEACVLENMKRLIDLRARYVPMASSRLDFVRKVGMVCLWRSD